MRWTKPSTASRRTSADKGIRFFSEIDQSKLAADAGIKLRPSTLLVFGNPPLGTQFITSNPNAGLDWPVRLLVTQEDDGSVWTVYSDFGWIARRHGIKDRDGTVRDGVAGHRVHHCERRGPEMSRCVQSAATAARSIRSWMPCLRAMERIGAGYGPA